MFGIPEVLLSFFLGSIVTVLVPYLMRSRYKILFDYESTGLAVPNTIGDLSYSFGGAQVDSFYRTDLYLRSFGNTIVKPDELSTEGRLEFFVTEGVILEAILLDGQSHAESSLLVSDDRRVVSLYLDRIGPNDHYKMTIFSDGSTLGSLECKTYILGKQRAVRKSKPIIESGMPILLLTCLFMIGSTLLVFPFGKPANFDTWWGTALMLGTIVTGYGGALWGLLEWLIGSRAKMRRLKKAENLVSVDRVIEV